MKKYSLLISTTLALIMLLLFFTSCGARKAEKTRTDEVIKTETSNKTVEDKSEESNVKKSEKTTVDDKNETVTKETSYEPIDPTKPASIVESDGKKTDLNNSKKTTKETTQKNNTKTDNVKASDENHKSKEKKKSALKKKSDDKKSGEEIKVEREAWSVWNFLWLLIPVGIYLAWKNKAKIIGWISSFKILN